MFQTHKKHSQTTLLTTRNQLILSTYADTASLLTGIGMFITQCKVKQVALRSKSILTIVKISSTREKTK